MSALLTDLTRNGWRTAALKHVAESVQTGPFGSQLHADDYSAGGRPVINPAHLREGRIEADHDCAVDEATFEALSHHALREGDVVIGRRGELGRCGVVTAEEAGWLCGTGSIRVRPDLQKLYSRWLSWLLAWSGTRDWLSLESVGSTMENLGAETVGAMPIPLPPFQQQRAIADYLDRATKRLDELLAAKRRLLGLLAEKRRALITRAVTRGIDSSASLRDSGISWLAQIPSHWEPRRIAHLFCERDERGEPELPLLEVSINAGVVLREFSDDRIESTAADFNSYKVARKSDIVFNKMRMWQGAVGVAPEDGLVSPDYTVAEPIGGMSSAYAGQLFRTEMFSAECARNSHGIVWDRLRLYWDEFRDIVVPLPSVEEQEAIVARIASETAQLDALRSATERTIALLKERRTALIAAAVTGRIAIGESKGENSPGGRHEN